MIGNHDDALYDSDDGSHRRARDSVKSKLREEKVSTLVPGIGVVWETRLNLAPMSFVMERYYRNSQYRLLVEHGHQYDPINWKGDDDAAGGQAIAEQINHMQESDPAFENIEYTPNQEAVKHLACLKGHPNSTQKVRDLIGELEGAAACAKLTDSFPSFWSTVADGIDYLVRGNRSLLDHPSVDPAQVKKNAEESAKSITDNSDMSPRVQVVVFGHTHLRDLQPLKGEATWAYANTGTWLSDIKASKDSSGCHLTETPSDLPYVKISKEDGEDNALVELKYFRGNLRHRTVKVRL